MRENRHLASDIDVHTPAPNANAIRMARGDVCEVGGDDKRAVRTRVGLFDLAPRQIVFETDRGDGSLGVVPHAGGLVYALPEGRGLILTDSAGGSGRNCAPRQWRLRERACHVHPKTFASLVHPIGVRLYLKSQAL